MEKCYFNFIICVTIIYNFFFFTISSSHFYSHTEILEFFSKISIMEFNFKITEKDTLLLNFFSSLFNQAYNSIYSGHKVVSIVICFEIIGLNLIHCQTNIFLLLFLLPYILVRSHYGCVFHMPCFFISKKHFLICIEIEIQFCKKREMAV